jgi:hypothetical protein
MHLSACQKDEDPQPHTAIGMELKRQNVGTYNEEVIY